MMIGGCYPFFLALSALIAIGDACTPMSVTNISLTFTGRLSWAVREEETCEITHFMVHMSEPDEDARFIFKSFTTTLNVDFFFSCEKWHFNIVPYNDENKGDDHLFVTRIPVPMDADLSLRYINITRPEEEGDLHLEWELNNDFFGNCSLQYRVTIAGDDDDVITDMYMEQKFVNLHFLSPCVTYEFGVRVVNIAPPTMEGPFRSIDYDYPPAVQQPPTLQSVSLGATTANITFTLEPEARNSCPIREVLVDGGSYFNFTIPVHDGIEREPVEVQLTALRPNSMYTLRVSVQNSAGWSPPNIMAVQTLPLDPATVN